LFDFPHYYNYYYCYYYNYYYYIFFIMLTRHINNKELNYYSWGVSPQSKFGCRWYALLLTRSVNTQLALCGAWGGALWCYWSAADCDGRATVAEVGWRRCCLEDCWECCSSLRLARWGVQFSEARELIRLVPT
jgi:hypothetical protein